MVQFHTTALVSFAKKYCFFYKHGFSPDDAVHSADLSVTSCYVCLFVCLLQFDILSKWLSVPGRPSHSSFYELNNVPKF